MVASREEQFSLKTRSVQGEVFHQHVSSVEHRSGVCLEYLKGTCSKMSMCPFSHNLKDYYAHVCKQKPYARVCYCTISQAILQCWECACESSSHMLNAKTTKRVHSVRNLLPYMFEDREQSDAIICILVRSSLTGMRTM